MPNTDLITGLSEGEQIVINTDGTASLIKVSVVKTSDLGAVTGALHTGDVATGVLPYGCIYRTSYQGSTVYFMAIPPTIDHVTHEKATYTTERGDPFHRIQFRIAMPWRVMAIGVNARGNIVDAHTWITKEKPQPSSTLYHPTVPNRYNNGNGCLGSQLLSLINQDASLDQLARVERVVDDMQRVDYTDHMDYWRNHFPQELQDVEVPTEAALLPDGLPRLRSRNVQPPIPEQEYDEMNRDVRRLVKWHLWTHARPTSWMSEIQQLSWQQMTPQTTKPLRTLQDALNGNRDGRGW